MTSNSGATPSWISGYGCVTGAGPSVEETWRGVVGGGNFADVPASADLVTRMLQAWSETLRETDVPRDRRLGVIFASAKGAIDDLIWDEKADLSRDSLTPVLEKFLHRAELSPGNKLCVSNACASSHAALFLARAWLNQGRATHVAVVAADHIGPFVSRGFQSLQALAPERAMPFARNRNGLRLGNAAAVLVLTRELAAAAARLALDSIALDTEGYAVTRPSQSGASLLRACRKLAPLRERAPSLVIAHGTGTALNDAAEDQVLAELFPREKGVPVTASKGMLGHTLGASGAVDVILACEALKRQRGFRMASTREIDPEFRASYWHADTELPEPFSATDVLVTSLGFGGMHAAAWVRRS